MGEEITKHLRVEPVTEPGETAEFWLDIGAPEEQLRAKDSSASSSDTAIGQARTTRAVTEPNALRYHLTRPDDLSQSTSSEESK